MCWWQQESHTGQLEQIPYEKRQPLKPTDTGFWCKQQDTTPKREEEEGKKGGKGGSSHVFTVSQSLWPAKWIRMIGPSPRKPGRWRDCQERKRVLLLFSHSVVSDSSWPHGLQHARLPCPSPSPRVCSNLCPLSWRCHPTILSSVVPFSSCLVSRQSHYNFLGSHWKFLLLMI